jgi:hypothetical protein
MDLRLMKIISEFLSIPPLLLFWMRALQRVLKMRVRIASLKSLSNPMERLVMISPPACNPEKSA